MQQGRFLGRCRIGRPLQTDLCENKGKRNNSPAPSESVHVYVPEPWFTGKECNIQQQSPWTASPLRVDVHNKDLSGHEICSNSETCLFKISLHIYSFRMRVPECLWVRVSQSRHHWYSGRDNSLLWGLACACRLLGCISGLYSWDVNITQSWHWKMSLNIAKCLPGKQQPPLPLRTTSSGSWAVNTYISMT